MKKIFTILFTLVSVLSFSQSTTVVISQVYGAGGNAGAVYNADYVELHNKSGVSQTLTGYTLQYASATQAATWSGKSKLPTLTIPAGGYYLIQMSTAGITNGIPLPTPDYISSPTISMSGKNARVALVSDTVILTGCPTGGTVIDLMGYGTTTVCSEVSPTDTLGVLKAAFRNNNGCDDTNNNLVDFNIASPNPRNSASPVSICGAVVNTPNLSASTLNSFNSICVNTLSSSNSFTIAGTDLTSVDITVGPLSGFTFSSTNGGTYTNTLTITQSGGTLAATTVYVKFAPTAVQSYDGNIPVSGAGATSINVAVVGSGASATIVTSVAASSITTTGATLNGTLTQGCSVTNAYGVEYSTTSGFSPGTGTVIPSTNLSGNSFSATITGLIAATTYYYVVYATTGSGTVYGTIQSFTTQTPSTGGTGIVISQVYGAGGNAGAPYNADYVELHNKSNATEVLNGYTIQYASATQAATWSGKSKLPTISIPAGGYYLIQMSSAGITNGVALPTPDYVSSPTISMSGKNARVALVSDTATLTGCPSGGNVIDLVGYGTTTVCSEASPTDTLSATRAAFRNNNGCDDTNNNLADFNIAYPNPRNSASPIYLCSAAVTPILSATSLTSFGSNCVNSTVGPNSFSISGSDLTSVDITVGPLAGYTFSSTNGGTYTNTLTITQGGGTLASTTVYVKFTPTAVQSYDGNISVSGAGATAINVAAVGSGASATTVSSGAASSITTTGATISGSLTQGCSAATSYGIQYSTTSGFTPGTGTDVASTNLSGTGFTSSLSGLTASTTYYYVAYAVTGNGTIYGTQISFTTSAIPINPSLSATTLTSFGSNCVNSTVGPNSFSISGTNLTIADITVGPLAGYTFSSTAGGTYNATLTITQTGGSLASTPVYVMFMPTAAQSYNGNISVSGAGATAINVAAVGSGASATTVSSGAASSITTTGASVSGTLTQGCSAATPYGIQYSTTSGFTPGTGTDVASTNLSGTGFTSSLSGLTASTTYYYVAYAVTGNGTIYGTQMSFTTSTSIPTTSPIAAWNFFGQSSPATFTATTFDLNLVSTGGLNDITRGSTAPSSTASNSFRTTGFKNEGISTSNTDYFQTTLQPAVGYNMSLSSINTRFNGTTSFNASPGVTSQFAYSLDNTTYTLIGSPSTSTSFKLSVDLSSVSALQNIGNGTTVYIRYYASGQTTTGGWGFSSPTAADTSNGLEFMGVLSPASISPRLLSSSLPTFGNVCVSSMPNPNTFTVSGTNLNAGDITVGPLAGYTFSTSAGGSYSNTLTITQAGGTLASTTVFVMFMPSAVQSYNGNISVSGAGATTINVAATGSGVGATAIASGNPSGVSSTVAMISGTLTQGCSAATSYGIQYSTTSGFIPGTGTDVSSTNLSGNNFSSSLSGLTASTTYYYVAYAITGGGTIYGSQKSFTTTAIPVVPTLSATAFQGFGNVCLGNSAGPYSFDITGVNLTATSITVGPLAGYSFATSSAGTYSSSLTITQSGGTLVATTVYVMFAPTAVQSYSGNISINGAGAAAIDVVTTGNGTLSSLSVISVDSISVSPNVEIIKGKIDDAGCSPVVSYGIEYSSFQNFVLGTGIKVASTNLNTNDSTFSSTLTGLIQNTAYYYRAYVSNNASTVYGDQKLFITSAIPTGLTIYSNPLIRGRSVHYTLSGINLTDHYLVRIYDISGRLVFSKPLYYQLGVNFIDDNFVLPSTLSCGVYSFQVVSPEFRIQKMVLIADYTGPFGWRPF